MAVLAGLILGFHAPLVFTESVLTDFDLFAYFYPYWEHRAAAFREGRLPLWNPYLFTGVPFLANPQAGVLYPLNWPFSWLSAPRAVAWSYLVHLWIAGAGLYALMRSGVSCGALAAGLGAVVFALGGLLAAQAGHINQVQAAAWLPWLVLALLKAGKPSSWRWALAGACLYALQFLAGHPQQVFITSGGLALVAGYAIVTGGKALSGRVSAANGFFAGVPNDGGAAQPLLGRAVPVVHLALIVLLGLGVAAAQVLPTLELARESVRSGGLSYASAVSFSLPPPEFVRAFLPTYGDQPASEYVAYVGVVALLVAWLGFWLGRPARIAYLFALIAFTGWFLAWGRFNPFYQLFYDYVPGFDLFRAPSRWLLLYGFGVAGLAGMGAEAVLGFRGQANPRRTAVGVVLLVLAAGLTLAIRVTGGLTLPPPASFLSWAVALTMAIGCLVLALLGKRGISAAAISVLVLTELFFARSPLPIANPAPPAAYPSIRPALAHILQDPGSYRVLSIADPGYEPGDMEELRAALPEFSSARLQEFVAASKYLETLTPNIPLRFGIATLDGYDGGLLPLKRYAAMKAELLSTAGAPVADNPDEMEGEELVMIRDRAMHVPDPLLLARLNVRYVIADRLWDAWVDGFYHDLGAPRTLVPGERVVLDRLSSEPVTAVSLATYLEGAQSLPQGARVAQVVLEGGVGERAEWTLRAGIETAESNGARLAGAEHAAARRVSDRRKDPESGVYGAWRELEAPMDLRRLTVEAVQASGSFTLAGVAFVDRRTRASDSPPADARVSRVHTGDVKVYEIQAGPKAFLDNQTVTAGGRVDLVHYGPGRVALDVFSESQALLVLADSYYPGWKAWTDGSASEVVEWRSLLRAVPVPAGSHSVVFSYEPDSFRLGVGLSLVSGAGLITAVAILAKRRR